MTTSNINIFLNNNFTVSHFKDFIQYLLKSKKLKFNYFNGSYGFALPYLNFRILLSNIFIEWYNQRYNEGIVRCSFDNLLVWDILKTALVANGKIRYFSSTQKGVDIKRREGEFICKFKGNPITLHVIDDSTEMPNMAVLLSGTVTDIIAKAILEIVNYKYGREDRKEEAGISSPAFYI